MMPPGASGDRVILAAKIMALEVLSDLLKSTSSAQLPTTLIEQIHELTGAQTVLLAVNPDPPDRDFLVYACPARRSGLLSPDALQDLCQIENPDAWPYRCSELPAKDKLKETLRKAKVDSLVCVSLMAAGDSVGRLILLNLPENERIGEVRQTLEPLQALIGMALKNAMAHLQKERLAEELEKRVIQRTAELQKANAELRQKEDRHQAILKSAMDGFLVMDLQGRLVEVNTTYCRMSGYSEDELLAMNIADLDGSESPEQILARMRSFIRLGEGRYESTHVRKDGTSYDVEVSVQHQEKEGSLFVAFMQDITHRKSAENQIRNALEEKGNLIKELYHRTKNTMQVIIGLLVMQADEYPDNDDVQQLVKTTEDRIKAISLVHQMLYSKSDLSNVSIKEYLGSLSGLILKGFADDSRHVELNLELEDQLFLIDTAIPLGLVFNELMTNSLKYAFPGGGKARIALRLHTNASGNIVFDYSDHGIGVAPDFDFRSQATLGLRLVYSIGEMQLRGKVDMESHGGVRCVIEFPKTQYKARV